MRFGILGAAEIAVKALIPALARARNARLVLVGSREVERAAAIAPVRVVAGYQAVIDDPEVDAVYIPLPNHVHREWSIRALEAGKHVLCEKPLALNAQEAADIAAAAESTGRLAMEAAMYRFNPRTAAAVAALQADPPGALWANFGFPMPPRDNYRWHAEMGGGALLDVGFYTVSIARWILGEPSWASATGRYSTGRFDGVDISVSATLGFPGGRRAFLFAGFDTPEVQSLRGGGVRLARPFTQADPGVDPYQLMVEAFSDAALAGGPPGPAGGLAAPIPLQDSIANLRVLDGVRRSLELGRRYDLAELA